MPLIAQDTQLRRTRRISTVILTCGSAMLLIVALLALPLAKKRLFNAGGPHWESNNTPAPSAPIAPRWNGATTGTSGVKPNSSVGNKGPTTVPVTVSIPSSATAPGSSTMPAYAVPNPSANPAAPTITLPDPTPGSPTWAMPADAPIPALPSGPGSPQSSNDSRSSDVRAAGMWTVPGSDGRYQATTATASMPYPSAPKAPNAGGLEPSNSSPGYAGSSDQPETAASGPISSPAQTVEPGVARLDGTIVKQARRPTYELARPSLY
jgi:hypothetical protein